MVRNAGSMIPGTDVLYWNWKYYRDVHPLSLYVFLAKNKVEGFSSIWYAYKLNLTFYLWRRRKVAC